MYIMVRKVNNTLKAWIGHVRNVAKAEGISYGKDAMKLAKKGKHATEWERIISTISKSSKTIGNSTKKHHSSKKDTHLHVKVHLGQ